MQTTPFAIHITWTCYGTWLPGDERGHTSSVLTTGEGYQPPPRQYGAPVAEDDPDARVRAASLQKYETVWLTTDQAMCVVRSFVEAIRQRRWWILRSAVMANHAHVLVSGCPQDGPAVRRILKGVSQAALSRQNGSPRRWWTESGSDRYKFDQSAIDAADEYIARQERDVGRHPRHESVCRRHEW